jgi:hypothetical protein
MPDENMASSIIVYYNKSATSNKCFGPGKRACFCDIVYGIILRYEFTQEKIKKQR